MNTNFDFAVAVGSAGAGDEQSWLEENIAQILAQHGGLDKLDGEGIRDLSHLLQCDANEVKVMAAAQAILGLSVAELRDLKNLFKFQYYAGNSFVSGMARDRIAKTLGCGSDELMAKLAEIGLKIVDQLGGVSALTHSDKVCLAKFFNCHVDAVEAKIAELTPPSSSVFPEEQQAIDMIEEAGGLDQLNLYQKAAIARKLRCRPEEIEARLAAIALDLINHVGGMDQLNPSTRAFVAKLLGCSPEEVEAKIAELLLSGSSVSSEEQQAIDIIEEAGGLDQLTLYQQAAIARKLGCRPEEVEAKIAELLPSVRSEDPVAYHNKQVLFVYGV